MPINPNLHTNETGFLPGARILCRNRRIADIREADISEVILYFPVFRRLKMTKTENRMKSNLQPI